VVVLSNSTNDIDDIARHLLDPRYELAKLAVSKERKEITVNPAIFGSYAGRYQLAPNFIITISRVGDALFLQATGQPRFQLFPESEREFFLKEVDAQITFVKEAGGVTALLLHQGGRDLTATKLPPE